MALKWNFTTYHSKNFRKLSANLLAGSYFRCFLLNSLVFEQPSQSSMKYFDCHIFYYVSITFYIPQIVKFKVFFERNSFYLFLIKGSIICLFLFIFFFNRKSSIIKNNIFINSRWMCRLYFRKLTWRNDLVILR